MLVFFLLDTHCPYVVEPPTETGLMYLPKHGTNFVVQSGNFPKKKAI